MKVQRTLLIDIKTDIELKKVAAELQVSKSDLYELAARILLSILKVGYIPDDLGAVLSKNDPEALSKLRELINNRSR